VPGHGVASESLTAMAPGPPLSSRYANRQAEVRPRLLDLEQLDEVLGVDVGVGLEARPELAVHPRGKAVLVLAATHLHSPLRVVDQPQRNGRAIDVDQRDPDDDRGDQQDRDEYGDADHDLHPARQHEPRVLGRRLQVRIGVDPRLAALPGLAAALLSEVLLHGVGNVLAPDAGALVALIDQRDHVEHVLEPRGVVGPGVASPRTVEALQRGATITAVDGGARVAEVAVGVGGHGGDGPYPFRHVFGTHA
jgi:hypothetical protein